MIDTITVRVGGVEYPTIIDNNNDQRFVENPIYTTLLREGILDLSKLAVMYQQGRISQREYAELNMGLGYSVSGFSDLSSFEDMEIENPLWESPKKKTVCKHGQTNCAWHNRTRVFQYICDDCEATNYLKGVKP